MMPTMRFKSNDGSKVFYFDSSPAESIGRRTAHDPARFALKNERDGIAITTWDCYSAPMGSDKKTQLRKIGTLEYQPPAWPGGPSKSWLR